MSAAAAGRYPRHRTSGAYRPDPRSGSIRPAGRTVRRVHPGQGTRDFVGPVGRHKQGDVSQMDAKNTQGSSKRRRLLVLGALGLAMVSSSAGAFSLALFTDQEQVDAGFTAGTIVLDAAKIDALTLTTNGMMPGDSVTDDVVVENDGSSQLRYAVSASRDNTDTKNLRSVLTVAVKTGDVDTADGACNQFDGTSVATATTLGATTAVVGSNAPGANTGDRNVAAGSSETLCFRVTLPSTAGDAFQGATTTTTFTFDAEQTRNNP